MILKPYRLVSFVFLWLALLNPLSYGETASSKKIMETWDSLQKNREGISDLTHKIDGLEVRNVERVSDVRITLGRLRALSDQLQKYLVAEGRLINDFMLASGELEAAPQQIAQNVLIQLRGSHKAARDSGPVLGRYIALIDQSSVAVQNADVESAIHLLDQAQPLKDQVKQLHHASRFAWEKAGIVIKPLEPPPRS